MGAFLFVSFLNSYCCGGMSPPTAPSAAPSGAAPASVPPSLLQVH